MQSPVRGKSGKEKTLKLVFLENGAFEQHEHGVEYSGEQQGKKRHATYHIIPPDFLEEGSWNEKEPAFVRRKAGSASQNGSRNPSR